MDGHDIVKLNKLLNDLKRIPGPKLLHVVTKKGKGLEQAERDPTLYHAPGEFNRETGEIIEKKCSEPLPPKYQNVFGKTIIELARLNPKIVGITPAMPSGCSLNMMMAVMPDRAFDVGIAEQHAVTFSAGLAADGMIPFCNIYSSFMQRAYDQVIHDVVLQRLHVVFCLDRGGLVGEDGPTHHGAFDLAYLRAIPGIVVASPMNERELRNMMFSAQLENAGPYSIRYPRGRGVQPEWNGPFEAIKPGTGRLLAEGDDIAILSIGPVGNDVAEVIELMKPEGVHICHADMRFVKPLDESLLHSILRKHNRIITVEDGTIVGGLGSAVLEFISLHNYNVKLKRLGVPDEFITQGTPDELHKLCGYDAEGIRKAVYGILNQ